MERSLSKACEEAIAYGIDLNLIECHLLESVEQRIDDHERALEMVSELQKGFELTHGIPQKPSQTSR